MTNTPQQKTSHSRSREPRRPIDDELRVRSLRTLTLVLPMMAATYAASGILYLVAPPFEPARPFILASALFAGLTLMLWGAMQSDRPEYDTPVTLSAIALATSHTFAMMTLSGEPAQGTIIAIMLVAAGGILYRVTMYSALVVVSLVGWFILARDYPPADYTLWAFFVVSSSAVGLLILWSRRNLMIRLHRKAYQAEVIRQLASDQAEKLARARDAALASSQAKGQFLANVSHEIRTPLNGILGLLQLIDANALPQPQGQYFQEVEKSGRSLLDIVNDILDLSKIEAGGMQLESVSFNVLSVVEEVVSNHASAAAAKGIELLTDLAADAPGDVLGDPLRLRQVITNLVSNAVKFTNEGEVVVSVRAMSRTDTSADLEFRVTDTGVGITQEKQQKIFEPFSQADTSTTRQYGGTGLGLNIAAQLVELMGGHLRLRSTPGEGSTFYFSVRLELQERLPEELRTVTQGLKGLQVLVLEGNRRAREMLSSQFADWGMQPRLAANFESAVQFLKAEPHPDIALIDLDALGDRWGHNAGRFVASAAKRRCAVIAMGTAGQDWNRASELGMRVHLTKPVRRARAIEALLEAVNKPIPSKFRVRDTSARKLPAMLKQRAVLNGHRILVAEDNDVNRMVVVAHLKALGYAAETVSDGEAALRALQADHGYSAVIMDGQMPKLDGYQATIALRKQEGQRGAKRVPVIALTAHAMIGDRDTALRAGMDDYISKPFTQEQLGEVLARWVQLEPSRVVGLTRPRAPEGDDAVVLDATITAQLVELDEDRPGFLDEVVRSFIRAAEENLATMRRAASAGDLEAVRRTAHMVKGSSQQLGAQRFGITCRSLETLKSLDGAESLLHDLEREFGDARAALWGLVQRSATAV